jgi:hypothetical protein
MIFPFLLDDEYLLFCNDQRTSFMLSVILHGRNDDHGYNYHKRLATSLNCIAAVLSSPQDEILFVDYNSPDELPTIVEAVQDTLTDRAKALLRVLRIRRTYHRRFLNQTSLSLLESVARNAAIRRSNPANRWILSTNPDMIFVPQQPQKCLTTIASELSDGFYALPRFELPERFWELSLERSNPDGNISFLREQGRRLHLHSIVRFGGFLQYDNPGDFQLMLREDIFQIRGFDERMLKRWHVDSNLCKRMSMVTKQGTLEKKVMAFHCNHTLQNAQNFHDMRSENHWNSFVDNPAMTPILSDQNWGLADEALEEIKLDHKAHACAISAVLRGERDYEFLIHLSSFNALAYSSDRILVYLADHLCHLPKTALLVYAGYNRELLQLLSNYLVKVQFKGKILLPAGFLGEPLPQFAAIEEEIFQASICIFDFGFDETSKEGYVQGRQKIKRVMLSFFKILKLIEPGTKCIGINVTHTDFYTIFSKHLSIRINSFATGICYGYLQRQTHRSLALKKRVIRAIHYFIVRYFFKYSDQIRSFVSRTKLSRHFKKFNT